MNKSKIVRLSHELLDKLVRPNDTIIDATLGNGYDSLYLSQKCKFVYAFDVQEMAIENAKKTLENTSNVKPILDSHENYQKYVNLYHGVIFNLGYLPTSDKSITTTSKTTIKTLDLMVKGSLARFILLVVYPGHPEGEIESNDLLNYIKKITTYQVKVFRENNNPQKAYIILLTKSV